MTHALRDRQYSDRDAQYEWFIQALRLRPVNLWGFSRINFVRTLMSKRKLGWLVDQKAVDGWNDPRFPTIQGVVRRGVSVESLRNFIISQGASRNIINLEWDSFWALNKVAYESTCMRLMAVQAEDRATLTIANMDVAGVKDYSDETLHAIVVPKHPKDESLGQRPCRVSSKVLLEGEDADGLKAGEEVILVRWGVVKITSQEGPRAFTGEYVPGAPLKKKKALSWVAASPVSGFDPSVPLGEPGGGFGEYGDIQEVVLAEHDAARQAPSTRGEACPRYDHLLAKPKLEEDDDLETPGVMTPVSLVETKALMDPMVKLLAHGDVIQLERRGFYRVDVPWRTRTNSERKKYVQIPRLIYIPDGKPQHKVPFSRLPKPAAK